ncbi:MAG: hypothetical protein AB8B72_10945 [Crocinitomicaceae bacterium]
MKKQLLILALALIASVGFYSCKKKYQVIPPPTPFSSIRDSFQFMYNENRQNFSFNATAGGQFVSEDGIQFTVPNYAFKDANGDTVLGKVDVELIEILSPSDMILMIKTTTADGDPLVTGGQFKATFTSNDNPVYISEDTVLYVKVPTDISDPNMRVFNGTEDATGFVNWAPGLDSIGMPLTTTVVTDTLVNGVIQGYYSFVMNSTSANWINCDYFYDVPGTKTELMVGLPDEHNNANTMFFIHFNGIQSVMAGFFDGNNFVSNGRIPVGTSVELVFVSEIDGDYKSKFIPITVSNGYSNTITLDPTTYEDIIEDITEL